MTPLPKCSAPAERAHVSASTDALEQLTVYPRMKIAVMHSVGPSVFRLLEIALAEQGLRFTDSEMNS
ncbi:DNA-binding protein [Exiguobacterium sp. SH5S13]|uniref:DNA-binding protein n=1 Tax=Exiguobacterium sp. SH5S13 TaxID=2510959 RepID=UPI00103C96D4|nr:DNA-binding protein [Exiguobacterium sp. SH5S13]TCI51334.1 DNA-binding protein [Exiguobacterium sp. SH5S13]